MEGSTTKRERSIDLIVQWIGYDNVVDFYKGSVSEEDVEVLKSLMFMGVAEREKHVRTNKESQISKVLQKMFVYNDDGDEEDLIKDVSSASISMTADIYQMSFCTPS